MRFDQAVTGPRVELANHGDQMFSRLDRFLGEAHDQLLYGRGVTSGVGVAIRRPGTRVRRGSGFRCQAIL